MISAFALAFWKVYYLDLIRAKFQLVFVADQASLNFTLSDTLKTGFLASQPVIMNWGNLLVEISDHCGSRPIYRSCFHQTIMSGFVNNVTASSIV